MKRSIALIIILVSVVFSSAGFLSIGDSVSKRGIFWQLNLSILAHQRGWSLVSDTSTNNTSSSNIVANYDTFIGDETFDYIILNYGLHDAANMYLDTVAGTTLFRANTCKIADSLNAHDKKIIWMHSTPMLGLTGGTVWGKDMEFWDDLQPRLDSIAHHVFDSIMGVANMIYVDQWSFAKRNSTCGLDSVHFPDIGYQALAQNVYDTMCKYLDTAHLVDPEWSSYGITAPDTNTTGMAEYSSYGIDARGFNNCWRGGSGYADSILKWSNESVPDSLDLVITLSGDNEILFTAGATYKARGLVLSGTSGHPDTLRSGTPGNAATLNLCGATVTAPYFYAKDFTVTNGTIIATTGGVNGGNTSGIQWPSTTRKPYGYGQKKYRY